MTKWLSRLKIESADGTHATKPAKPHVEDFEGGFAGFVASLCAPSDISDQAQAHPLTQAVNDALIRVSDADRWRCSHSPAMNAQELGFFMARVARFTERGLSHDEAKLAAEKLVVRDREQDERRYCLECVGLQGQDYWRCKNWLGAQVPRDGLPRDFVMQLQRCPVFRPVCDMMAIQSSLLSVADLHGTANQATAVNQSW